MIMKGLMTLVLSLLTISCVFAQDKLYKKDGNCIHCKIDEVNDDYVKYKKTDNLTGPSYTVKVADITKITFENGSEETFNKTEETQEGQEKQNGFDRNSEEFVNYATALAKTTGDALVKRCANNVDNSTTEVYYDSVIKDPVTGEILIPIRISWDKGWTNEKRWIKGSIKVAANGTKTWTYQSDSGIIFSGCAKMFTFQ